MLGIQKRGISYFGGPRMVGPSRMNVCVFGREKVCGRGGLPHRESGSWAKTVPGNAEGVNHPGFA